MATTSAARTLRALTPMSRFFTRPMRKLDGRTKEARFLKSTEAALVQHLGGPDRVSAPQRFLIQRLASNLLRLELYDERLAAGERLTDYDGKILSALQNSVRLGLRDLGLKSTPHAGPTLAEALAEASE